MRSGEFVTSNNIIGRDGGDVCNRRSSPEPERSHSARLFEGEPARKPIVDGLGAQGDLPPALLTVGDFESHRTLRNASADTELQARQFGLELPAKSDLAGERDEEIVICHGEGLNEASQQEWQPVKPERGHNRLAKTTIGLERDKR
jgi:hypothetical protein